MRVINLELAGAVVRPEEREQFVIDRAGLPIGSECVVPSQFLIVSCGTVARATRTASAASCMKLSPASAA